LWLPWTLGGNTSLGDAQNGLSLLALVGFSPRDSIIMFASNMSISLPGVPCGTSPIAFYHYILKPESCSASLKGNLALVPLIHNILGED
jgi:hypothetical protein